MKELNRLVVEKGQIINKKLFKKYFGFQDLTDMQRELYKNTDKNTVIVNVIKNGLGDLRNKIEEMSEDGAENKRLYDIVNMIY